MKSQKNLQIVLVTIFLNCLCLQAQELPESPIDQDWTKSYNDPIELTKKSIAELNIFWSPVTYYSTMAVYGIGSFVSIYGGAYVLLESPNLAVDMLKGGFYEVGSTLTKDFILNVIETTVKTPKKSCINITQQLIKDGLKDYKAAYGIVKKYRKSKQLTEDEALDYLAKRWGIIKLPIAKRLYNDVQNVDYSINQQIAEKTTEELLEHFENNYHRGIGEPKTVGIVDAAFFVKDVRDILGKKKLGLPNYVPYQNFEKKIEMLNREMMEEKERLNSPEDFEEFANKFFNDEQFQRSRIIFPLKVQEYDLNDNPTHVFNQNNWEYDKGCPEERIKNGNPCEISIQNDGDKMMYYINYEGGAGNNYYFKKNRNKYFLVELIWSRT
jgi:hypothetical protein